VKSWPSQNPIFVDRRAIRRNQTELEEKR